MAAPRGLVEVGGHVPRPGLCNPAASGGRFFAAPSTEHQCREGEKAVLAEYLHRYRMTFELTCEGLTAEQLATRSVPPSTMSLLGMIRHLARVEHS